MSNEWGDGQTTTTMRRTSEDEVGLRGGNVRLRVEGVRLFRTSDVSTALESTPAGLFTNLLPCLERVTPAVSAWRESNT